MVHAHTGALLKDLFEQGFTGCIHYHHMNVLAKLSSYRDRVLGLQIKGFRPILMTTAAMVLGVMPLVLASGAGAVSRNNIGLVITVGLSIGTLFTLFVVPVMYALIAEDFDEVVEAERLAVTQE